MLLKRYSRASDSTALGYTMPLVMPPFMTRSQYLSATLPPSVRPCAADPRTLLACPCNDAGAKEADDDSIACALLRA